MSDEYGNSGKKGSLVNDSASAPRPIQRGDDNYATGNYPPPGDTTSSGGWGSPPEESWSDRAQRGFSGRSGAGLINQSVSGGDLADDAEDATEAWANTADRRDAQRVGGKALNPYGDTNPDTKDEAREMLAGAYSARKNEKWDNRGTAGKDAGA